MFCDFEAVPTGKYWLLYVNGVHWIRTTTLLHCKAQQKIVPITRHSNIVRLLIGGDFNELLEYIG